MLEKATKFIRLHTFILDRISLYMHFFLDKLGVCVGMQ